MCKYFYIPNTVYCRYLVYLYLNNNINPVLSLSLSLLLFVLPPKFPIIKIIKNTSVPKKSTHLPRKKLYFNKLHSISDPVFFFLYGIVKMRALLFCVYVVGECLLQPRKIN